MVKFTRAERLGKNLTFERNISGFNGLNFEATQSMMLRLGELGDRGDPCSEAALLLVAFMCRNLTARIQQNAQANYELKKSGNPIMSSI